MEQPTRTWVDVDPETQDHYIFYNYRRNGSNLIIIPKQTDWEKFQLTETPTCYMLTVTPTKTDNHLPKEDKQTEV